MAINGIIFQNQKVSAEDHAALFELFITDGIISGCGTSTTRNLLTITSGLFVLKGRLVKIVGSETIEIPNNIKSTTVRLIAYIDTNQKATKDEFEQVKFRLDQTSAALVQEDINTGTGHLYEVEWATLTIGSQSEITKCDVKIKNAYASGGEGHGTDAGKPSFSYMVNGADKADDQTYVLYIDDGNNNWRLKFLKSGTLTFSRLSGASDGIDVFLVGGGGGSNNSAGGGGGYTKTLNQVRATAGTSYPIVIGEGGTGVTDRSEANSGSDTTAFGGRAEGGKGANGYSGGNGGSGGAGPCLYSTDSDAQTLGGGSGGSDGSDGKHAASYGAAGQGQGTTTREFGDANAAVYGGGGAVTYGVDEPGTDYFNWHQGSGGEGGGGNSGTTNSGDTAKGSDGAANTGGGGGRLNAKGGSGVVVIRNVRSA